MALVPLTATPIVGSAPILDTPFMSASQTQRFPLKPSWGSNVEMAFEFKTDLGRARKGREFRRCLRTEPRKSWKFDSGPVRPDNFRIVSKFMMGRFGQIAYLANPVLDYTTTTADIAVGDNTLSLTDFPGWIAPDSYLILSDTNGQYELVRLFGAADPVATIHGLFLKTWPAGTRVRLAEPVRLSESQAINMETRGVATLGVDLSVDPGGLVWVPPSAAVDTYNDREIFLKQPNWKERVAITVTSGRETVDYGQGRISVFNPVPFVDRDYSAVFVGRNSDQAWAVVDFFLRQRGRQGEFYVPTGTADLVAKDALTSAGTTLKTPGLIDYITYADVEGTGSALVNKAIFVALRNGSYVPKTISSVAAVGGDTVFTLDSAWGADISLSDIAYISYLPVCRFGSDTLTVEWLTNRVAQFSLPFHTLEYLEAE